MPRGQVTIASDEANRQLMSAVGERLHASVAGEGEPADILLCTGVPEVAASHIVVLGGLTDELDEWDRQAPPQTVAGALWVPQEQNAEDAIVAWLLLRLDTPTTPLSDLTDSHERALRWSVVSASSVRFPAESADEVGEAEIRTWLDDRPEVGELGRAIDGIGGDTADAVLESTNRFREAMRALDGLVDMPPPQDHPDLDHAISEQLRQVQRTGFGRWRSTRARAECQAATSAAARSVAADRLRTLIEVRREQLLHLQETAREQSRSKEVTALLESEVTDLALPVEVDFGRVQRSWTTEAPAPRRYVLINSDQSDSVGGVLGAALRQADLPAETALCMVVQSGFSLPAVR